MIKIRTDPNWVETRVLAEDLSKLLGVPVQATEDFLLVLENLIVHKIAENVPEDSQGKDISVELPYLGTLVVSINERNAVTTNFVIRNTLYKKIRTACHKKESPLTDQISNILGQHLVTLMEEGSITDE